MTSTEIARTDHGSLPDRMKYAQALASASLLPKAYQANPGNVLMAMELGDALGIRPIQAITGIHVIEGKPSASADLIASLIRRAGHRLRVTGNDQEATASIIRADDPDFTFSVTWTMDRAKAAGLTGKGVWKSYPAAMLKARAITEVAREGASDALYGVIYSAEELGATVDASGEPVQEQRPQQQGRSGVQGLRDAVRATPPPAASDPMPVSDVVDAEVVTDDEPAEPAVPMIDPRGDQMKALHASLNELGMGTKVEALAFIMEVLDREVVSSKDLTRVEAGKVLNALAELREIGVADAPPADAA